MEIMSDIDEWRPVFAGTTAGRATAAFLTDQIRDSAARGTLENVDPTDLDRAESTLEYAINLMVNRFNSPAPYRFPSEWDDPTYNDLKETLSSEAVTRYIGATRYPTIVCYSDCGEPPAVLREVLALAGLPVEHPYAPIGYTLFIHRGSINLFTRDNVDHGTVWQKPRTK